MPAVSEDVFDPAAVTPGPLAEIAEKVTGTSEEWKITKFETTPPVRFLR